MNSLFSSPFFGIGISVFAYAAGLRLQRRFKWALFNPLLIAIALISGFLCLCKVSYEQYNQGGAVINLFLGPATACLAVSIYTRIQVLKENWLPIAVGCMVGSLVSMGSVYGMCRLFGLDQVTTVSLLPKSVTTPIAAAIAQSKGGMVPVTVIAVIFTGITGSILSPFLIRLLRMKDPVAVGISIGASSHAMGTAKAVELGETEGAMSGLAIGVCGLVTLALSLLLPL